MKQWKWSNRVLLNYLCGWFFLPPQSLFLHSLSLLCEILWMVCFFLHLALPLRTAGKEAKPALVGSLDATQSLRTFPISNIIAELMSWIGWHPAVNIIKVVKNNELLFLFQPSWPLCSVATLEFCIILALETRCLDCRRTLSGLVTQMWYKCFLPCVLLHLLMTLIHLTVLMTG